MQIQLTDMPAMRIGGVRHVGPYNQIRSAFEKLAGIAGSAGFLGREGVTMLGVYHDDPSTTPEDQLRSDAAVTLPNGEQAPDGLTEHHLSGGRFLKLVHVGSYERLGESWQAALDAATSDGRQMRQAASYEIYINVPGQVSEDELKTELYVPIE